MQPTFILDFPKEVSPMFMLKPDHPDTDVSSIRELSLFPQLCKETSQLL